MNVPFDLSQVLFIATANSMATIPAALLDRMELITVPGYTMEEKVHIAQRHLMPKQLDQNGLTTEQLVIPEDAIQTLSRYHCQNNLCQHRMCMFMVTVHLVGNCFGGFVVAFITSFYCFINQSKWWVLSQPSLSWPDKKVTLWLKVNGWRTHRQNWLCIWENLYESPRCWHHN